MALFTDTVTIYNKTPQETWTRTVVKGVQWSEKTDKQNDNGKLKIVRYASLTFPEGTYEGLTLDTYNEEDCIVFGEVNDEVTTEKGHRIGDLLKKYPRSGLIRSVNDTSNRSYLKHIKVVVGKG